MPISAKYLAHFGKKIMYRKKERIFILSLFRKGVLKMSSYSFHLSSGNHSVSNSKSLSKIFRHNYRQYLNKKDYSSEKIIELLENPCKNVKEFKKFFNRLFSSEVAEYNLKQKRDYLKITDYYDSVCDNLKQDVGVEIILQIGEKSFWDNNFSKRDIMKDVYKEHLEFFKKVLPELAITNATLHMDEASPHLHIVGIPKGTGYKKGLTARCSKRKVFDKLRLTRLQKSLRENAQELMHKHVIQDFVFDEKMKGRNYNFDKESIIQLKKAKEEAVRELVRSPEVHAKAVDLKKKEIEKDPEEMEKIQETARRDYARAVFKAINEASNDNFKKIRKQLQEKAFAEYKENYKKTLNNKENNQRIEEEYRQSELKRELTPQEKETIYRKVIDKRVSDLVANPTQEIEEQVKQEVKEAIVKNRLEEKIDQNDYENEVNEGLYKAISETNDRYIGSSMTLTETLIENSSQAIERHLYIENAKEIMKEGLFTGGYKETGEIILNAHSLDENRNNLGVLEKLKNKILEVLNKIANYSGIKIIEKGDTDNQKYNHKKPLIKERDDYRK